MVKIKSKIISRFKSLNRLSSLKAKIPIKLVEFNEPFQLDKPAQGEETKSHPIDLKYTQFSEERKRITGPRKQRITATLKSKSR